MFARALASVLRVLSPVALCALLAAANSPARAGGSDPSYEHDETRQVVALVDDAAELVRTRGEGAWTEFRVPGSRWRQGDAYVFVLDPDGNMIVHPDPSMEGRNELALKDINGKAIIRGLLDAAIRFPGKPAGWYHYEWPVPGGLLPRWKSSYVRLVTAPSGKRYVVGSGAYNDRMERAFVVDAVTDAVRQIEASGTAAFPLFHDPTGPFLAKDTYVFVYDRHGTNLVLPAFPNLEGRELLDMTDTQGKPIIREMLKLVETKGSGWVDYLWPKPGESVPTQKSAYVSKARMGNEWVLVGSGVYLADAPKAELSTRKMKAPELMTLVRDAAVVFGREGEKAYPEFRKPGSRWLHDNTYFFVWSMEGTRLFHAANPSGEGRDLRDLTDILGRPFARMFLETAASPSGEGWVHYVYPEPGSLFPTWKSTFVKKVTFPSGEQRIIGCGIYNMQMDKAFLTDVVDRAAALVAERGKEAFGQLRDRKGPFVFMDTYVFVDGTDGTELVNAAQPSLEGKNLLDLRDLNGKPLVRDYIDAATKQGEAWVEYSWYKPGHNTPARKVAYVRKVESGPDTYILGSGFYPEE